MLSVRHAMIRNVHCVLWTSVFIFSRPSADTAPNPLIRPHKPPFPCFRQEYRQPLCHAKRATRFWKHNGDILEGGIVHGERVQVVAWRGVAWYGGGVVYSAVRLLLERFPVTTHQAPLSRERDGRCAWNGAEGQASAIPA